jgi:hypothetical protein
MKKLDLIIGEIIANDAGVVMSCIRFENMFIEHDKKWNNLYFTSTNSNRKKIYQKKYWK